MPRIPKVPAELRRAYGATNIPKPRAAYGNDILGFYADRWGRINRAEQDLADLDEYALKRRAYGGYDPRALNDMRAQINAARVDAARDFNRESNAAYRRYSDAFDERRKMVDDMANAQMAYNRRFIAENPLARWDNGYGDVDLRYLKPYVDNDPMWDSYRSFNEFGPDELEMFGNQVVGTGRLSPDRFYYVSYPGTERYLESGIPEEGSLPNRFIDEANMDMESWRQANQPIKKSFKTFGNIDYPWDLPDRYR